MNTTRDDTLFALRYAVRVLERNVRFWTLVGYAFKFCSVFSGTMALGAVTAGRPQMALALGMVFAAAQALDVTLDPSAKKAESAAMRREYARVLSGKDSFPTFEAIESAYQAVVADDGIVVMQGLRELAYDDVVMEWGLDTTACYSCSAGRTHQVLSALS